ncbi:hypothetical protein MNB_SV-3-1363 [hydrothermal vent metagenome]|uniref:Uncharacterized protein n=1 Tax=hydrothermal vent metagenome TaxID=652676 RepID=A0A1W1BUM2_9ZZZZ
MVLKSYQESLKGKGVKPLTAFILASILNKCVPNVKYYK